MKICLVVEGAYPYVQGGVSSWIHQLMTELPEYEFVVQTIVATREDKGKFKYTLPPNLTEVRETFLQDGDVVNDKSKRLRLSKKQREVLRSIIFKENEQWEGLFEMFHDQKISVNDVLMGYDFYSLVHKYYEENYPRVVFTDFLWTMRSVFMPIMLVLKNKIVEADIYHSVSTGYAGIMACCAGHIYKKPAIITEHGIYTREREEEIIRASWTKGIYKDLWINHFYMLSRCAYERAQKVYSLFARAQDLQIELGCPEEKTAVVHNGVNYENYLNLPQKDPSDPYINIGAIVRITPIKDIKTMISAFCVAKEKMPHLRLFIIGSAEEDPEYYRECVSLIEMLGVTDIIFTGYVSLKDYIGKMDMIILSSISEGQPLSILEAMAAGKPCITTRVGDCYDMLRAGDEEQRAGLVVPVMNVGMLAGAMQTLAQDEALRRQMGENGQRIVRSDYDGAAFIKKYREIYFETYHGYSLSDSNIFTAATFSKSIAREQQGAGAAPEAVPS